MANILIYTVEEYDDKYFKIFSGVYNDFKNRAFSDYMFELSPLEYDDFIRYINEGLLKCIILFEDNIPTAFLAYTTVISESIELNIIHSISTENINHKRKLLLDKFLEINNHEMTKKVVTYPLLGTQADFEEEILNYGFEVVHHSVMKFPMNNIGNIKTLSKLELQELPEQFRISDWDQAFFDKAVEIIHNSFKNASDAYFDTRFKSITGTTDIIEKITTGVYGNFLEHETKMLLCKNKLIGICFANLTNSQIANIPLIAISSKYRSRGFSEILLKSCIENIINSAMNGAWGLIEVNASVDNANKSAVKMYKSIGFTESYTYPQAYRPITQY